LGGQQIDAERGELGAVTVTQTTWRTIISGVHGSCGEKKNGFIFYKIIISIYRDVYDALMGTIGIRTLFFTNSLIWSMGKCSYFNINYFMFYNTVIYR